MSAPVDFQRFAFVVQTDHRGMPATTEWAAHDCIETIARALCDNDLPNHPVIAIIECNPSEGSSRFITEDVARVIPGISAVAHRDGWRIQACARDLMERFDLEDGAPAKVSDFWGEAQRRADIAKDARIMAEVR